MQLRDLFVAHRRDLRLTQRLAELRRLGFAQLLPQLVVQRDRVVLELSGIKVKLVQIVNSCQTCKLFEYMCVLGCYTSAPYRGGGGLHPWGHGTQSAALLATVCHWEKNTCSVSEVSLSI